MGKINFGKLFRKYVWVVSIPTIYGYLIYADYTHTQEWKAKKRAALEAAQKQNQDSLRQWFRCNAVLYMHEIMYFCVK